MEPNTKTTEYTHLLAVDTASTTEQHESCWEQLSHDALMC